MRRIKIRESEENIYPSFVSILRINELQFYKYERIISMDMGDIIRYFVSKILLKLCTDIQFHNFIKKVHL